MTNVMVHACNPTTQEDCEFQASLDYLVRPCLKKTKKVRKYVHMLTHTHAHTHKLNSNMVCLNLGDLFKVETDKW
jgi:hypothetical protein